MQHPAVDIKELCQSSFSQASATLESEPLIRVCARLLASNAHWSAFAGCPEHFKDLPWHSLRNAEPLEDSFWTAGVGRERPITGSGGALNPFAEGGKWRNPKGTQLSTVRL